MDLRSCHYWVFDLDGTLTEPVHDFDAIREMLGLPADRGILEALDEMCEEERAPLAATLDAYELELAQRSVAAPGARETIDALRGRGAALALLTRNNRVNVETTLAAIGLADVFLPELVVTREDELRPKPEPDGLLEIFSRWAVAPAEGVMVGNHVVDLLAGRSAGTATVHVDRSGAFEWPEHADVRVRTLSELV